MIIGPFFNKQQEIIKFLLLLEMSMTIVDRNCTSIDTLGHWPKQKSVVAVTRLRALSSMIIYSLHSDLVLDQDTIFFF
jgi:hypothetical protein